MGTWHLEIMRMICYISFPVGLFHWFNQPENFTEFVEKTKKEHGDVPNLKLIAMYDEFVESMNKEKDLEALKAMEAKYLE